MIDTYRIEGFQALIDAITDPPVPEPEPTPDPEEPETPEEVTKTTRRKSSK